MACMILALATPSCPLAAIRSGWLARALTTQSFTFRAFAPSPAHEVEKAQMTKETRSVIEICVNPGHLFITTSLP